MGCKYSMEGAWQGEKKSGELATVQTEMSKCMRKKAKHMLDTEISCLLDLTETTHAHRHAHIGTHAPAILYDTQSL